MPDSDSKNPFRRPPAHSTNPFLDSPDNSSTSRKHKDGTKPRKDRSSKKKAPLDKIDRLDVTGLYGSGFHHDGPFDACNPHRNKNSSRAPVAAFPKDSASNSLKGASKTPPSLNTDQFYGDRDPEAFNDFAQNAPPTKYRPSVHPASFDPARITEPVHGLESLGLGTSTFLEGAPASRVAMERTVSQEEQDSNLNKLARSKSLAQRFRANQTRPPPDSNPFDDVLPDSSPPIDPSASPPKQAPSLLSRVRSLKVGNPRPRDK